MAIATWSWIFFIQLFLAQTGFAQLNQNFGRILARRVVDGVFVNQGLSQAQKTRNVFIGVAVAASVVLIAGVVGLTLFIRKARHDKTDPEAPQIPPVEKPNWWMVEGGDSKADWWRLSLNHVATEPLTVQVDTKGGRTDRLKTALQLQKAKVAPLAPLRKNTVVTSPADTITLPMQFVPAPDPSQFKKAQSFDEALPVYSFPSLSPPKSDERLPKVPQPIVINPALLRTRGHSDRRAAGPRSPSNSKRRSKLARNQRNPFLPPRTPVISHPMAVSASQLSDPKLAHPLGKPRSALRGPSNLRPPVPPKIRPAPLNLEDDVPKVVRFAPKTTNKSGIEYF